MRQIRAMLHAWDKYGLINAERDYHTKFNTKHRNPDADLPSFRRVVKGKIEFLGMVRGKDNHIYRSFLDRFSVLDRRDKGIPSLRITSLAELGKVHVFTEGKTDRHILLTAWRKLYDDVTLPFVIEESDPFGTHKSAGGGGGAKALNTLLNAHRQDAPYMAIGLFDRDAEGSREYQSLHRDFATDVDQDWKASSSRPAGAFLLPTPDNRKEYARLNNLCIEFYFDDSVLEKKTTEGFGLSFAYASATVLGQPIDLGKPIEGARTVKDGKTTFAERIVPGLDAASFNSFRLIFDKLIKLINRLQEIHTRT